MYFSYFDHLIPYLPKYPINFIKPSAFRIADVVFDNNNNKNKSSSSILNVKVLSPSTPTSLSSKKPFSISSKKSFFSVPKKVSGSQFSSPNYGLLRSSSALKSSSSLSFPNFSSQNNSMDDLSRFVSGFENAPSKVHDGSIVFSKFISQLNLLFLARRNNIIEVYYCGKNEEKKNDNEKDNYVDSEESHNSSLFLRSYIQSLTFKNTYEEEEVYDFEDIISDQTKSSVDSQSHDNSQPHIIETESEKSSKSKSSENLSFENLNKSALPDLDENNKNSSNDNNISKNYDDGYVTDICFLPVPPPHLLKLPVGGFYLVNYMFLFYFYLFLLIYRFNVTHFNCRF
jgi:hypothetical protein